MKKLLSIALLSSVFALSSEGSAMEEGVTNTSAASSNKSISPRDHNKDQEIWTTKIEPYVPKDSIFLGFLTNEEEKTYINIAQNEKNVSINVGGNANTVLNNLKTKNCLNNIKALDLSQSGVTFKGVQLLKDVDTLEFLDLSHTPITGKALQDLPLNIKFLKIEQGRNIGGYIQHLNKLKNLEVLGLAGATLQREDIENIKSMESLKYIDLSMIHCDDDELFDAKEILKNSKSTIIWDRTSQQIYGDSVSS